MSGENDPAVREILVRLGYQDQLLREIRDQARQTNGRVTALERFQARVEGHAQALSWRTPLIVGVICTALGAGLTAYLG